MIGKVARGGNIPLGYYKDPEKTAATFVIAPPTASATSIPGDFATVEADGTITLLGRGSVCINTGGEKVFPEEVEPALKAHPDVFDAIVVGVPDERWGQRVARRRRSSATGHDLDTRRPRPARPAVARRLQGARGRSTLVDEIVRSPSGKPDYPWALELAAAANIPS